MGMLGCIRKLDHLQGLTHLQHGSLSTHDLAEWVPSKVETPISPRTARATSTDEKVTSRM